MSKIAAAVTTQDVGLSPRELDQQVKSTLHRGWILAQSQGLSFSEYKAAVKSIVEKDLDTFENAEPPAPKALQVKQAADALSDQPSDKELNDFLAHLIADTTEKGDDGDDE